MDFLHVDMSSPSDSSPADTRSIASNGSQTTTDISTTINSTITSLLEGYSSLSVPQLLRPLSSDFHHRVLPESLGMPVRDQEAFASHASGIFSIFSSFRLEPVLTFLSSSFPPTVIIRAKMLGTLKTGAKPWQNECLMIIRLSSDGNEVVEIQEFVDSAKALEMARRHAPKEFGAKRSGGRERHDVSSLIHTGIPTIVSLLWLVFSLLVSKVIGGTLALIVLWMHPVLEVLRANIVEELPLVVEMGCSRWLRKYAAAL